MSEGSFVSTAFRQRVRGLAEPIARGLGRLGLSPNALTVIGFAGTCAAAVAAVYQQWILAGVLVIVFGIFDLFDGALARATGRASKFGAFLDSTLDRTGENLVYAGIAVGCAMAGFIQGVLLAVLAVAFASVVTYTRAKAEVVGLRGDVGVAPRPERLLILTIGLVLGGLLGGVRPEADAVGSNGAIALAATLGLIAGLSAITVLQRILNVKEQLDSNASN